MPISSIVISPELIRKTIEENNYLSEESKNYMTSQEFRNIYGPEVLSTIKENSEVLNLLFGLQVQNKNSLVYHLEQNKRIIHFYGQMTGWANTRVLNYSKDHNTWRSKNNHITEKEACEIAGKIKNALIKTLQTIKKDSTAIDIQKELIKNNLPDGQLWLKKYLTVLFPDKFMPMVVNDWIIRIFLPLGLEPTYNWFEDSHKFSNKAKEFGIDSVQLYHVVYKCVSDQVISELNELGIDPDELANPMNLLITTKTAFDAQKEKIKSEEMRSKFEEYLSERYSWKTKQKPLTTENSLISAVQTNKDHIKKYVDKLKKSSNIIFRGAPGTGKSYLAKEIAADIVSNGKFTDYSELKENGFDGQVAFVQFHPSYDYSDFVEGLRPVEKANDTIGFKLEEGIFKKFVGNAKSHPEKQYVFIIDEINRGEISKIFGELFYSIEPSKRGKDGEIATQYANMHSDDEELFYIPENVYIIGTMNDIDRSVDSFDFAMRRRFKFVEISAEESQTMLDTGIADVALREEAKTRMNRLNASIKEGAKLNSNYFIGASYFMNIEKESDFEELWNDNLQPLLQEYIVGSYEEDKILEKLKNAYNSKKEDEQEENNTNDGAEDESDKTNG